MGNLLGSTWWAVAHAVYVETMAATVEEIWFEVTSLFYFREKIIEQYFAILLRHTALWISTVNVDFAKYKKKNTLRGGCQRPRTSVYYLIYLITLKVYKLLD